MLAGVNQGSAITVVVAEELALYRAGLISLIRSFGSYHVAADAADGDELFDRVLTRRPDLAVVDLHMPGRHALEVVREGREASPSTRFVLVSRRDDRKTVLECLRAGARGVILKSSVEAELREALVKAYQGSIYLAPSLDASVLFLRAPRTVTTDPMEKLSAREYQVFSMLVEGLRAKEVAARLELSPKTVDTYRASLMKKLDIHDLAGLVKFAVRKNLVRAM
jgi:DNA-binding NarL/FixJ family response regulator